MKQYEMLELSFEGKVPAGTEVSVDMKAVFSLGGKETVVKGFYAGEGVYKVRFLPETAGTCIYQISGSVLDEQITGTMEIEPADENHHGLVRAEGIHLRYSDGKWFYSFGTTVYALAHQSDVLMEETLESLSRSPFNKVRMCVFPKHYNYNHNNPNYYAFEHFASAVGKNYDAVEGSQVAPMSMAGTSAQNDWDVNRPCFAFWDGFEDKIKRLGDMGIQVDLILFHPYDRWGFANMPQEDNLIYLDYLLRRFAAFPNIWWSLANEYDLCPAKTQENWEEIEEYVAANDPYHHLLSNHNCFNPWDWSRKNVTHVSWQSKQFWRVPELVRKYQKPVLFDECRYEGNIPEFWGNLSGRAMTQSFWRVMTAGGYCTHGETFLPGTEIAKENSHTGEREVVWWARGGRLHGESPARIAFLREIIESLPGPLSPERAGFGFLIGMSDEMIKKLLQDVPEEHRYFFSQMVAMDASEREKFLSVECSYAGRSGNGDAFLYYKDTECSSSITLHLPADRTYTVEVIDTWEMTRNRVLQGVCGRISVDLPGKEYMAVLATAENLYERSDS